MRAQEINAVLAGLQNEDAVSRDRFMGLLAHSCACMLTCLLPLVIDGTVYFVVLFFCT